MSTKIEEFIESSFLSPLIGNNNITDISYNGEDIFYQDNQKGRVRSQILISDKEAYDFIRQIANLSESMFSVSSPILDISSGRYRINATHYSISKKRRSKVINFSIRIGYDTLRITNNNKFIPSKCLKIIDMFLENKESIIISGITSSGKTEFQKFLLSRLEKNTRIIIIDNVDELETDYFTNDLDSSSWIINDKTSFDLLIRNALRINPDWIIVSESRGEEMLSLLNSAMTGHPTISTIHSKNIESSYSRMARMCMIKNSNLKYDETLYDIYDHFRLLIHLSKKYVNGKVVRYVSDIGTVVNNNFYWLYKYPNFYNNLPITFKNIFNLSDDEFSKINKEFTNE